ncbi:hypothetical protein ACJX0J_008381, partial [Zea mays]
AVKMVEKELGLLDDEEEEPEAEREEEEDEDEIEDALAAVGSGQASLFLLERHAVSTKNLLNQSVALAPHCAANTQFHLVYILAHFLVGWIMNQGHPMFWLHYIDTGAEVVILKIKNRR